MEQEKKTVLVVDDIHTNIEILAEILQPDYRVKFSLDGEMALRIANGDEPPDLILLDIMMPEVDGYEVCRKLKIDSRTRFIPVIFVSALNETINEEKGFEIGCVDYITKPVNPALLKARVKNHIFLKQARDNLIQQNEVLQEIVQLREEVDRITRHDLQTPLTAFINIPTMLKSDANLTPDQVELMEMLEKSAFRMMQMINNSLDLVKMERGKYRIRPISLDVVKIFSQICRELEEFRVMKNLKIVSFINGKETGPNDSFEAFGEEKLFFPLLSNLIKNALEASPVNGVVTVFFSDRENCVIKIHNLGEIPSQIRQKFFEKYATFGKTSGTGLGVYSAKLMAKTLGGDISFDSSEKSGTTMYVEFPKKPDFPGDQTINKKQSGVNCFPNKLKILIVDDSFSMREVIKDILRAVGFSSFMEASNGKLAIEILKTEKIDLVISDWFMPEKNGFELLQEIKGMPILGNIPFLLISGSGPAKPSEMASLQGNIEFLQKPFSCDDLIKKIRNLGMAVQ
ncbi:response regulator [bacterium]|nr:response regulator [bacterium]